MVANIRFEKGYVPGCVGRIAELHGRYYAVAWKSDSPGFELLVARELADFVEAYDSAHDLLLTAYVQDLLVGSVAIVGRDPDGPRLRWYIVDPVHHGHGIGAALLNQSIEFCHGRRFKSLHLWTVTNLPESSHLYEKVGFKVTQRVPDDRWCLPLENLKMEMAL